MSNYTAPDKNVDDQWSPLEHNEMKAAINSKFDQTAILTDTTASDSNNTVFSSKATNLLIDNIVSKGLLYKGNIDGTENLNSTPFNLTGFWISKPSGFANPAHTSFPTGAGIGILRILANNNFVLQEYTSLTAGNSTFVRSYNATSGIWTAWIQMASQAWVNQTFQPVLPDGTPTVPSLGAGITVDLHDSVDLKGFITVTNNSGFLITAGTNIHIQFQYERPDVKVLMLEGYIADQPVSPYSTPNSSGGIVRITTDIANNGTINFFYLFQ